ncbi:Enoyl-CoA hydratase domain-containing protein 2 [Blattella germanica]|nr:Enoyl-CoA hydratase domain-containing protein 2 [Blattella germanica]
MLSLSKNVIQLCNRFISTVKKGNPECLQLKYLEGIDNGIIALGMNRPEAKNAFSRSFTDNFFEAIEAIKSDKQIRAVIIRSLVPGAFCSGADLKERSKMTDTDVKDFVLRLRSLTTAVQELPMPVIAAIDGFALGGGFELALACDLRTAASNVKIGLVETKLGIIPGAGGTQRLPRLIGPSLAKELIFTGRIITGLEAHQLGIVNQITEQNEDHTAAYLKALEIAREIILNGPVSIRMAKKAIDSGIEVDINTGNIIEGACYNELIPTKDRIEGGVVQTATNSVASELSEDEVNKISKGLTTKPKI